MVELLYSLSRYFSVAPCVKLNFSSAASGDEPKLEIGVVSTVFVWASLYVKTDVLLLDGVL